MSTRTEKVNLVLDKLRGALGTGENPPGSNWNFIVEWYNQNVEAIGRGAWCEMTHTWSVWTTGFKALKRGRAYTVWACQDAQAAVNGSSWHWGTDGVQPGDQFYYDWDQRKDSVAYVDHTGTVEQVNADGTFYVLEGNQNDVLRRVLRDSKYVVGYARLNYDAVDPDAPAPVPAPPAPPVRVRPDCRNLQDAVRTPADNEWGNNTDANCDAVRMASLFFGGKFPRGIQFTQRVVGTPADGIWGPKSRLAHERTVAAVQTALDDMDFSPGRADGDWGPKTEAAYQAARSACHI